MGSPGELTYSDRRVREDIGEAVAHCLIYFRNRPYPYDSRVTLTLNDGGGADAWGAYTQLIPAGTFDFGVPPNRIKVNRLVLESIPANDTYIIEFASSPDAVAYTILGAVRFVRLGVFLRSFPVDAPCRPFPNDTHGLYARLKSAAGGGGDLTLSLNLAFYHQTSIRLPPTTGTWPTG